MDSFSCWARSFFTRRLPPKSSEEVYVFSVTDMGGKTTRLESTSIKDLRLQLAIKYKTFYPCTLLYCFYDENDEPLDDSLDLQARYGEKKTNRMDVDSDSDSDSDFPPTELAIDLALKITSTCEWNLRMWMETLDFHASCGDEKALARASMVVGRNDRVKAEMEEALADIITRSKTIEELNENSREVLMMVRLGVDVNTRRSRSGKTILERAARLGHMKILKSVTNAGADLNVKNCFGHTPLHKAAANGQAKVTKALVNGGADLLARGGLDGFIPLHDAVFNGHKSIVRILIEAKAHVDVADNNGYTSLHLASILGRSDMICMLIEQYDADILARSRRGETPMDLATKNEAKDALNVAMDTSA